MCAPKTALHEYSRTEDLVGNLIESLTEQVWVSECCSAELLLWNEDKQGFENWDYDKAVVDAVKRVSDRVEAVASAPVAGETVAYQVRRTDGSPLSCWEPCTKELCDLTKSTGRYSGYKNGPPCEVRTLGVIDAAPRSNPLLRGYGNKLTVLAPKTLRSAKIVAYRALRKPSAGTWKAGWPGLV